MTGAGTTRVDLQALRGLAVLLVVVYHARLVPFLKAGYLGVDIFFVISGYMVTRMILVSLAQGNFSVKAFYVRRAQRLLPAAYATLALVAAGSAVFSTTPEMLELALQQAGALTFVANVVLWSQTGYFETAAQLKPLLHFWSLSLEEQYYLLLPVALIMLAPAIRIAAVAGLVVVSLGLALAVSAVHPGAAFYLLPFRAWELGLGTLVALGAFARLPRPLMSALGYPAVAALIALPVWPTGWSHPGFDALVVCLATAVLIERAHPEAARFLPTRVLAGFGDISYSLYLVHWPIFAFAASARVVNHTPWGLRCALVSLAILSALALYLLVERPYRYKRIQNGARALALAFCATALLALAPFGLYALQVARDPVDVGQLLRLNMGLDPTCEYGSRFEPRPECSRGDQPNILLWGDSYAMHLADAIAVSTPRGLVQATKKNCGPLLHVAAFETTTDYTQAWAADCIKFTDSVITYLASTPSIQTVVLSSYLSRYLAGGKVLVDESASAPSSRPEIHDRSEAIAEGALAKAVATVRSMGKKVVLVAPPPALGDTDIGRCLALKASRKFIADAPHPDCSFLEKDYLERTRVLDESLRRVSLLANLPILRLDEVLCRGGRCAAELQGVPIYIDNRHLSHEGSRLIGERMNLGERLAREAR